MVQMNTSLSYFFPFCLHLLCGFLPPCPYLIVSRVSSIQEAQACSGHVKNEVLLCFAAMLAASGFSYFKFPGVNDGTDLSLWVFLWCVFCAKARLVARSVRFFQLLHLFLTCFCWEYLAGFVTFQSFACLLSCYFCSYCYILFCPRTDSRAALISSCYLQACANCSRSFSSRKGCLQQQLNLTPGILFRLRSVPWIHLGLQLLVRGGLKLNSGQFWSMKLNSYNSLHLFAGWKCTFFL